MEREHLTSLAAALIGTAYRMTAEQAVRALCDGLATSASTNVVVRWSLPEQTHRALALASCERLGLNVR